MTAVQDSFRDSLVEAESLLQGGELQQAEALVADLLKQQPRSVDALVVAGRIAQRRGDPRPALDRAGQALRVDPLSPGAAMLHIEMLLQMGEVGQAREELDELAERAGDHARMSQDIAQLYMHLDSPALAEGFYARATAAEPRVAAYWYNHSTALIALGKLDAAELALDTVIALKGDDGDAWYNRSTLRRQTSGDNHVEAIEDQLQKPAIEPAARVPLYYSLAKELEDLGSHERSFDALTQGAGLRRKMLSYRVEDDEETMRELADAFHADYFSDISGACEDARPIFVLGLPRSGTTLVDRILSSHSKIGSRGESSSLALNLTRLAAPARNKAELIRRSVQLDGQPLGEAFCAELPEGVCDRVVDKTPANFLYLGLIAKALPRARIVHVRRNPMDVCYAMYKTLFRMAYPFSYDLDDLARYWLVYDGLMAHWRDMLPPEQLLEIDYEQLVTEPEAVTRRVLEHVGMPWEEQCLAFDRNPLPSLTASAAQVRMPIYTSSVGLWRRYETQLAPLAARLRDAGVEIDMPADRSH